MNTLDRIESLLAAGATLSAPAHVHDQRRIYRTDGSNTTYLFCPGCQTVLGDDTPVEPKPEPKLNRRERALANAIVAPKDSRQMQRVARKAHLKGAEAIEAYLAQHGDTGACGGASIKAMGVDGRTRMARLLREVGFESWSGRLTRSVGYPVQSIDAQYAYANAYADVFAANGVHLVVDGWLN